MKFAKGPKVEVIIELSGEKIISSRLFLSDRFSVQGANQQVLDWVHQYLEGTPYSLHLNFGTAFQSKVALALQKVPLGQTVSYSELGSLVGCPKGARAIGNTMNKNPFPLLIPCHRVIHIDGSLGGFSLGIEIKKRLLEFEAEFPLPLKREL